MMLYQIHSHAQIQDLQARSDELGHSNKSMLVGLVSLESVRIACESYALLRPLLMESWMWVCPELEILFVVAGLSVEIQKLEHDVLPQLMVQEAKLERGALEALLLMKNSAVALLHMRKCFKEALGVLLCEEDLVSAKVEKLSIMLKDIAVHVLKGKCNIVWLQERVPLLVQLVTDVLETPVRFCDPDEYSDEYSDIKSSSVCAVPAGSSNCSAAVCQKEKMLYKIHSHAQIQALQARSDELGHSNEHMLVKLVSLESVRIARESYALLCPLIMESRSWECLELDSLSVVAGLSLEIQKLEHDLLPQLMVQEAKLERGALEAILLMKNSAITLLHLSKCFKEALGVLLDEEDLVSAQVEVLSIVLKDIAVHVLEGNCNGVWLQPRVPLLVQLVTNVLEIPVRF